MEKIFTDEFLKEIQFERIETSGQPIYGKARSIKPKGLTILEWNNEGHFCTYSGDRLESNVSLGILKDGGTRTAFNGYIYSEEQVKKLLELTS